MEKTIDLPRSTRDLIAAAALNDQAGSKLVDRVIGAMQLAAGMAVKDFDPEKDKVRLVIGEAQVCVTREEQEQESPNGHSHETISELEPHRAAKGGKTNGT